MELIAAVVLFGACFAAMSVGVVLSNKELRGSCGGVALHDADGDPLSCGACPRQEREICPSDEPLVRLAQIGHPNPRHHR